MARPINGNAPWPARWPSYLPFPQPIPDSVLPVPNAQSVRWSSAQFAPLYLPPGHPSYQSYSFTKSDVPLARLRPVYTSTYPQALAPYSINRARSGPSGDTVRPPYLGGLAAMNPAIARYRRFARKRTRQSAQLTSEQIAFYRARMAQMARANCEPQVMRFGSHMTDQMISPGVPEPLGAVIGQMPDPIATARANGLALENGIALQNALALENGWWESATTGEKVMAGIVALAGAVAVDRTFKLGLTSSIRPYAY